MITKKTYPVVGKIAPYSSSHAYSTEAKYLRAFISKMVTEYRIFGILLYKKELINPDYEGYADCELFTTNF